MNWKTLINKLLKTGLTEEQIALAIRKKRIPMSQSTIHRYKKGKGEPKYKAGRALEVLLLERQEKWLVVKKK